MVHLVDTHVGKTIRQCRWLSGMTQQSLAEAVGIKFQQVQKYETGANRVSASRLWDISNALGVRAAYFFEGLPVYKNEDGVEKKLDRLPDDLMDQKEAIELMRTYFAIPKSERRRLLDLARVLSGVA
jgi:transcriptional regulator with XRE-family HTH domain